MRSTISQGKGLAMANSDKTAEMHPARRAVVFRIAFCLAALFITASFLAPLVVLLNASRATQERWSFIGQAFGMVGAVYSGLAFAAVGGALFLQSRQLG